jgi:carbon starvation protein
LPLLAIGFLTVLALGYWLHSGFVARQLKLDPKATTPAHAVNDGQDFVPTRPFYLFGQHFSAIAAAGPIAGPILACQSFGWLPCLLWIGLGVVFVGAVHDFLTLAASVRHGARSIAEITREELGGPAGRALLAFIGLALVYVIVAFTDVTAQTFLHGDEPFEGQATPFNPGGAVALASTLYLLLGVLLGVVQRVAPKLPLWLLTVVFVPATFVLCWSGTIPRLSQLLVFDPAHSYRTWCFVIVAYCGVASLLPVWSLLQPRGYLGGFILYSALAAGLVGVFLGEPVGGLKLEQPAFKGFDAGGATGLLFPFLFVTIACGACSGFHGLVCSGTTSKQVDRETHARPVGYGAMLAEAFVALIALVIVATMKQSDLVDPATGKGYPPGRIYGDGIGRFVTFLFGKDGAAGHPERLRFVTTFGAMAFSTFVFDTLDVCTRLGRYIVQELLGWKGRSGALGATCVTMAAPLLVLGFAEPGKSVNNFWTLFGASNQLLAALTLLTLCVWLARNGRRSLFAFVPMLFVLVTTLCALVQLAWSNLAAVARNGAAGKGYAVELVNGTTSVALIGLALFLVGTAWSKHREWRARPLAVRSGEAAP